MVELVGAGLSRFCVLGEVLGAHGADEADHARERCVVTSNKAVYFSIVVSLKETFTLDAKRDITLPNLSIRNNAAIAWFRHPNHKNVGPVPVRLVHEDR